MKLQLQHVTSISLSISVEHSKIINFTHTMLCYSEQQVFIVMKRTRCIDFSAM